MTSLAEKRTALESLISGEGFTRVTPPLLVLADPYFNLAGEEFRRRLLLVQSGDGAEHCLRPDFTLPIAQAHLANGQGRAAYSYIGALFRQRADGPAEFEQAGLELIAEPDADAALDRVLRFGLDALDIYGIGAPTIRLGSVALFEALLAALDMPDVWRPRLRHRFGHPDTLARLLRRLSDPHGANGNIRVSSREELVEKITTQMLDAGLPLSEGRSPEEIADRFIEKQALAIAYVPAATIDILTQYLSVAARSDDALTQLEALDLPKTEPIQNAIAALTMHAKALATSAPRAKVIFDAGFSPRLDYYTGLVFEFSGSDGRALVSGGQYDRLMQRLGAGQPIAASGCAAWVDRMESESAR